MEEFPFEFQGPNDPTLWRLDPDPEVPQPNSGILFDLNGLAEDDFHAQWPPNTSDPIAEPLGFFDAPEMQSGNSFSGMSPPGLHDLMLELMSTGAMAPAPVYSQGDFWSNTYQGIENFSMSGSSVTSDTLSPSSEQQLPLSPASSMSTTLLFGSPQQPPFPAPVYGPPAPQVPVNFSTALIPPFGHHGNMEVRARATEPFPSQRQRRGRRRNDPVGHPRLSARELRRIHRSEKCQYCNEGYPFKADLQKHIYARHTAKDDKPQYPCTEPDCSKVYTRSDRRYRHGVAQHGWPPGGKKRRSRAVDEGNHS